MQSSFLTPDVLKESIHAAEQYMKPFHDPLDEFERLAHALPGKVPKGKPNVTDGTIAGIIREGSRRVIQQLPTGKVTVKKFPDIEDYVNAVLTDDILLNANSGGTPYTKAKGGVKSALTVGRATAYCYYNRRGSWFGADFTIPYAKDVLNEKGKTSEFDCNTRYLIAHYTLQDLKTILRQAKQDKESRWKTDVLQDLIDGGEQEKEQSSKTYTERVVNTIESNGYVKLVHCFQVGVGATFYTYSQKLDKVVAEWVNNDPRGIIPLHDLFYEEDMSNPMGESLTQLSAGKQNLLDFDMQMYQYGQGMSYSPTLQKWGDIPTRNIKLAPDTVIDMGSVNSGSKLEVLDINNAAINNFGTNYGLIKSQIQNETGMTGDSSVSAESGNPGFSKTDAGVNALQARLGIADNSMKKNTEAWLSRVYETLLNIHFAESKGKKELELQLATAKQLKLEAGDSVTIDYDKDMGPIKFTVDAGTTEAADNAKETEGLMEILTVTGETVPLRKDRQMALINQIIQNSGVDDPEKLQYTDEEIADAKEQAEQEAQMVKQQMTMAAQQAEAMATQPTVDPNAQMQADPAMMAGQPLPPEEIASPQEDTQPSQGLSDDEAETVALLQERGVSDDQIATAITMLRNGYEDDDVMRILQGVA